MDRYAAPADINRAQQTRLKTFSHKSFPPQRFLFLLQDALHGFPRLFTVISEHICFLLFSFSVLTLFSCRFRAVD